MKCKFKLIEKKETEAGITLMFIPANSGSPENEQYFKYTPFGQIQIGTINKDYANTFIPGKEYYVEFTDANTQN